MAYIIILVIAFYFAVMLGMFMFQRSLMYYPETEIFPPEHYGLKGVRVIPLVTTDGTRVEAWYNAPPAPDFPIIVYFHGNAGHVGDRIPKLRHFSEAGFGLLAVSYRGYGNSKGNPTEEGLYDDAKAAIHYALRDLGYKPEELVLYGESLGSGVATHIAKMLADLGTPAGTLVLEAPYTSVARRSQELYRFIPAYYLVKDRYDSLAKIDAIACPLLLFHGELDTVIPIAHGRELLAKAKAPKRGVFFDEVDHTGFDYPTLTQQLTSFIREHGVMRK